MKQGTRYPVSKRMEQGALRPVPSCNLSEQLVEHRKACFLLEIGLIISGTASINNKGEVMYPGDIEKQTLRMWENVETLLNEASCTFDDVMQIIVYLRDISDCQIVKSLFDRKFPQIPWIITLAPVCRPQWLIEMECVAVKCENNPQFKNF